MSGDSGDGPRSRPGFASRLSESEIWKWQRAYFHQQGPGAWRTGAVPHAITNNPVLAHGYAELVFGFLRDCREAERDTAGSRGAGRAPPFSIIELGGGSGRFGYLFLKALTDMLGRLPCEGLSFRYVLTDFTDSNVAAWRSHPAFRPFIEQGVLDFAVFDAERDDSLTLIQSGETLLPGTLQQPLVVIANYVFDSIPQDAFSIEDGHLSECLISLGAEEPGSTGFDYQFESRRTSAEYYPEPRFNALLGEYLRSLDRATVLFPCAALRCLQRLAALSSGRLLLLTGDKGYTTLEELRDQPAPWLAFHGSVSLMVNFHALGAYVAHEAGQVLTMQRPHQGLCVAAYVLGLGAGRCLNLELAFHRAITQAGPDDFFLLRRGLQNYLDGLSPEELLALVHMSHDDPRVLGDAVPVLLNRVGEMSGRTRHQLFLAVRRVWDNYYHLQEEGNLAFELGVLLFALGHARDAAELFQKSLELAGETASTLWNIGLCYYRLDMQEQASRFFGDARRLEPDFYPTGALQLTPWPAKTG